MLENLIKCQHSINFIRDDLLEAASKSDALEFLLIEKLLIKTMELKTNLDRFVTAKEINEI